jgi:hypothetical protein
MKQNQTLPIHNTLDTLANTIHETNLYFLNKAQNQVNTALTFRNWVIGYCIVEYEQSGKDRADYALYSSEIGANEIHLYSSPEQHRDCLD